MQWKIPSFDTSSDSQVGEELYKLIFEGYTVKQWGRDPKELNASVTARIPVFSTFDPRYFADKWQGLCGTPYHFSPDPCPPSGSVRTSQKQWTGLCRRGEGSG